ENALRYAANAQLFASRSDAATRAREFARVGEIMLKVGEDPSAAIEQLKEATSIDPNNPEYLFQVGKGLAEFARQQARNQVSDGMEEMRDALDHLDAAVELRNDHAESYYERGTVNLALGNVDYGVIDLQKAVEYAPDNSKFLAELGQTLQSRAARDSDDPEGITSKILDDYRQSIDLFDRYVNIESPKEAARKEAQSREVDDELPIKLKDVLLLRAKSRSALAHELTGPEADEQFQQVITDCRSAMELDPEDIFLRARAGYHVAIAESMLGNMDAALVEFNRAIRTPQAALSRSLANEGTPPSDAVVRRGIVWYRLGDREMAFLDFREAAEATDPRGHFWQGIVHAEREEFSRAIDSYSDAIRIRPDYIAAYKNRGLAYLHLGLYRRAADDFEELIRRNPHDKESYRRRDVAFEKLGIRSDAAQSFQFVGQ
ncbi:MAG: tetratricopeptide repeat protein, partial [Planctomycetota bacterium]|nr:tetratricopeptide repeat protein [Planctomycetota bacterium]